LQIKSTLREKSQVTDGPLLALARQFLPRVESIFHQSGRRKEIGAEEKVPIHEVSVIIDYGTETIP
jgi:hypothetical protein